MHGLGSVDVEVYEPVFHNLWEKAIFGTMLATMGQGLYNLDEFRHGIEVMNSANYLTSSYYEHWIVRARGGRGALADRPDRGAGGLPALHAGEDAGE